MPRQKLTAEEIQDEAEKFFLEQAKAYYRNIRAAAENAPYGKMIAHADAFAFQNGRELIRKSLEHIVQEQNDILKKKRNSAMFLRTKTFPPRIPTPQNPELLRRNRHEPPVLRLCRLRNKYSSDR